MSIYVSTTFLQDNNSVIKAINILLENNISNIELGSTHRNEKNLKRKLNNYNCNYITHNFFPPDRNKTILNLASVNENILYKSLDFMKQAIDFAIEIGAPIYTVHPGFLQNPSGKNKSEDNYDWEFYSDNININYDKCFNIFLNSLKELIKYIENKPIKIAIETQGSYRKKDFMLFKDPNEYINIMEKFQNPQIGFNLNLAHLKLASESFNFDLYDIINKIKKHLFAIEVSHNIGLDDSHRELEKDGWYLDVLKKLDWGGVPIIFEGRNINIKNLLYSYKLLEDITNE